MSTISEGYDGKPTRLKFSAREGRKAELWIEQEGVERVSHGVTTYMKQGVPVSRKNSKIIGHSETLAYVTLEELLNLRDEINSVIQEIVR